MPGCSIPGIPAGRTRTEVLISSTWGLAGDLVGGQAPADLFRVNRKDGSDITESRIALKKVGLVAGNSGQLVRTEIASDQQTAPSLTPDEIGRLMTIALAVEDRFRVPLDMEWCLDHQGKIWLLQVRPLRLTSIQETSAPPPQSQPILSGGITIFPGRAIAPVKIISQPKDLPTISEGVILVVPQAVPEIGAFLPVLAGFIAEQGHPTGHAATLLREFGVPSLFEVPLATQRLKPGALVSLDATHRQVFQGSIWPDIRERTLARLAKPKIKPIDSPLHDLILKLKLTDPQSRQFRPEAMESIHDVIRFVHEKGIASLFEVGDRESRKQGLPAHKLSSELSFNLFVQDLGGGLTPEAISHKEVKPEDIRSIPFLALWKGISHPQISWSGRTDISIKGFASVMSSSLSQDMGAMRKLGDPNYLLVAQDYLNLNIRLAYHYAMIDSLISPVTENNYVNFRFRGGGGSLQRRDLRARFLSQVLLSSRFSVDLRGDLVTAWLRGYPQQPSEAGLELLGKLMGCARQLDMLMENESSVRHYVDRFLAGDYPAFA